METLEITSYNSIKKLPKIPEGIYSDNESYYYIKYKKDLNELIGEFLPYLHSVKFKQTDEGFTIFDKDSYSKEFKRMPISYFDVNCPICNKTVLKTSYSNKSNSCFDRKIEIKKESYCSHYVGKAIKLEKGYIIDYMNIKPYKIINDSFLVKINDQYEELIKLINNPQNSFWTIDDVFLFRNN